MTDSGNRARRRAILVGVAYFAVGFISAALAKETASSRMILVWRGTAFMLSGIVFAGHLAYEHFCVRNSARASAWYVSAAVAIGAFLLALAANIHELVSASGYRPRMLVALPTWPLLTAVPAFLVALVLATGLTELRKPRT